MTAYLVTTGDGEDGSEWDVEAIFTTLIDAERYVADYRAHRPAWATLNPIEEWALDPMFRPADYPHDPPKPVVAPH